MASRFSKRTQENDDNVTAVPAIDPDEVLLPGEGPAESAEESDNAWTDAAAAFSETASGNDSAENAPAENDNTPQEESEMTDTVTETIPAQSLTERLENDGYKVTDAAATLLAEAEANTVTMLDIESLPKDAKILKMQLSILEEFAEEYSALRKELKDGTSGKDEKVAEFLAENDVILAPVTDENGEPTGESVDLKNALAEAQEAREKAIAAANAAEAALMTHIESELSKMPGGVMSEEDIKAKTEEIKLKYAEYVGQHKAAKDYLDNYRQHKNADVGEIHQYVTHIDRPSGRATTSGSGTRNAPGTGAGRSVHVSGAFFSRDNGATWEHATQEKTDAKGEKITLSNPQALAVALGQAFSTTVTKEEIVDAWYAASDQTRETATKANMPNEKVFPLTFKDGNGNDVTTTVKIQKRQ